MNTNHDWLTYDVEEIVKADKNCLWHHLKPHQVFEKQEQMIIVEGNGLMVKDIRGREYLDATSGGVWSVMVGYGRDSIAVFCRCFWHGSRHQICPEAPGKTSENGQSLFFQLRLRGKRKSIQDSPAGIENQSEAKGQIQDYVPRS